MAIIMKDKKETKKAEMRQVYTWAACGFVAIFLISIAIPIIASKSGDNNRKSYNEKYSDLAAMPFSSDAAANALLASAQYQDIGKRDLLNTLFSRKDKEERQAEDAELGAPPPPDEEYQEAAAQQERAAASASYAQAYVERRASSSGGTVSPTSVEKMGSGGSSGKTSGTGTSGMTTNVWRGDDSARGKGGGAGGAGGAGGYGKDNKDALLANVKGGRQLGFYDAYAQSGSAAKNKDLEKAAQGAASAFQGGKGGKNDGDSKNEKDAMGLGEEAVGDAENDLRPGNMPGLGDLDKKLDDKKKENDKNRDPCAPGSPTYNWWKCEGANMLLEFGKIVLQGGIDIAKTYANQHAKNNYGNNNKPPQAPKPSGGGNTGGYGPNAIYDYTPPSGGGWPEYNPT